MTTHWEDACLLLNIARFFGVKAVAYCRVSTIGQRDEGVSLEMQRERIASWCTNNGYEADAVFVEVMSGGCAANRPELQKAVTLACRVKGILVVYSLSRLARSVKDTLEIAERLEKSGANLASLSERIDTSSALGKMVFRLLSTLNEFERDQLAERTACAMAHLRKSNRRISSRIPLGYDLATDGNTLLVNPGEQKVVAQICAWRQRGMTMVAIAEKLHDSGVPTKAGGTWHPSTVRGILERQQALAA
ncbi:MAG: recombinase family protein [Opitutaceae bacterium]